MILRTFARGSTPLLASLLLALGLLGCATRPAADDPAALAAYEEANDRFEPLNRKIYAFNNGLHTVVLGPIVAVYRGLFPKFVRDGVWNFLNNLEAPVVFINDVLQGEGERANITLGRFVTNTALGAGGLFDVAEGFGLPYHDEDFGQTLAVGGAAEGSFVMIPFYGPSTTRDSWGLMVDILFDPLTWLYRANNLDELSYVQLGLDGLATYEANVDQLEDVRKNSIDGYAALRSFYRQFRDREIRNGRSPAEIDMPDEFDAFDEGMDEDAPSEGPGE